MFKRLYFLSLTIQNITVYVHVLYMIQTRVSYKKINDKGKPWTIIITILLCSNTEKVRKRRISYRPYCKYVWEGTATVTFRITLFCLVLLVLKIQYTVHTKWKVLWGRGKVPNSSDDICLSLYDIFAVCTPSMTQGFICSACSLASHWCLFPPAAHPEYPYKNFLMYIRQ